MDKHFDFISKEEEARIIQAIEEAEDHTSGEIRIHIEKRAGKNPVERAKEVFNILHMDETKDRNGVLIYVGTEDHSFAIIGDKGINDRVESHFWEDTKELILTHFKNKQFCDGLVQGVLHVGLRLKSYFPYQEDDIDELPNEISRG